MRSSVVFPIAETTTTTPRPPRRVGPRGRRRHGCDRGLRQRCRRTSARPAPRRSRCVHGRPRYQRICPALPELRRVRPVSCRTREPGETHQEERERRADARSEGRGGQAREAAERNHPIRICVPRADLDHHVHLRRDGQQQRQLDASDDTSTTTPTSTPAQLSAPDYDLVPGTTYSAKLTTTKGEIDIALDTVNSPVAAGHFIKLARTASMTTRPSIASCPTS